MPARIQEAAAPTRHLYRIGRAPNPLAWPPLRLEAGNNRFDDPRSQFRVLYAAEQRLACFVETLAAFRPSVEWLAAVQRVRAGDGGDDEPVPGSISSDWLDRRALMAFALAPHQRWLDLRTLETRAALRRELAPVIAAHDAADFDLSDALSRNRSLTQAVARWAYEADFSGIAYKSRFDCAFDCWAIFDRARLSPAWQEPLASDDADLMGVAQLFDLTIP